MRYQRVELHNHSTESDGTMTASELMLWAEKEDYGVVALTDHNTCSGHGKAEKTIREERLQIELLKGVEVTTFYGHILALGIEHMINFTDLDPRAPEKFLGRLRAAGAAVIGLAHPFCLGRPVTAGCRMDMEIHDWGQIDYIEVFNTSGGTEEMSGRILGNRQALEFWEEKVLEGYCLAAVSGKDIHQKPPKLPVMITYALLENEEERKKEDLSNAVLGAIMRQKTIVTKGPLLKAWAEEDDLWVEVDHSSEYENWNLKWKACTPVLWIRGKQVEKEIPICFTKCTEKIKIPGVLKEEQEVDLHGYHTVVLRMYDKNCGYENLLAAGISVRWKTGGAEE